MTDFPLLTNDVVDPAAVTAEYVWLCGEYNRPVGTSLRTLAEDAWRNGAQLHQLGFTQRVLDRGRDVFAYLTRTVA